jgi:hypothetical protein
MKTLTTPPPAEQATKTTFCIDCGEAITGENSPCTPAHCQFEGVEDEIVVMFSLNSVYLSTEVWVSPSTHLETVVEAAAAQIEEEGIDLSEAEFWSICHKAVSTPENGYVLVNRPVIMASQIPFLVELSGLWS